MNTEHEINKSFPLKHILYLNMYMKLGSYMCDEYNKTNSGTVLSIFWSTFEISNFFFFTYQFQKKKKKRNLTSEKIQNMKILVKCKMKKINVNRFIM